MFIVGIILMALLVISVGPNILLGGYLLWQYVAQRRRGEGNPKWAGLWLLGGVFMVVGWRLAYGSPYNVMLPFLMLFISDVFWGFAAFRCWQERIKTIREAQWGNL